MIKDIEDIWLVCLLFISILIPTFLLGCKVGNRFVSIKYHTIERAVKECEAAGGLQSVDYSGNFTCSNGLEGKINK